MTKWLQVDCDWGARGLWVERGRAINPAHVPISEALRRRIVAWNDWYTEWATPWDPNDPYNWDLHQLMQNDIGRFLKQELPDWTIIAGHRLVLSDGSLGEPVPYPGEHLLRKRD